MLGVVLDHLLELLGHKKLIKEPAEPVFVGVVLLHVYWVGNRDEGLDFPLYSWVRVNEVYIAGRYGHHIEVGDEFGLDESQKDVELLELVFVKHPLLFQSPTSREEAPSSNQNGPPPHFLDCGKEVLHVGGFVVSEDAVVKNDDGRVYLLEVSWEELIIDVFSGRRTNAFFPDLLLLVLLEEEDDGLPKEEVKEGKGQEEGRPVVLQVGLQLLE